MVHPGIPNITGHMHKVFLGQDEVVKLVLAALLAGGHILLEGVPGVGKTLIGLTLARLLRLQFRRIQFTNDLLPSDVTGFHAFRRGEIEPELMPGPIFASIVLADEINRTSPKTQSALLEAMEEGQVTIDGLTYALPVPFLVIATQNPLEIAGTFPLPESQLDRFLMKITVGYPPHEQEKEILSKDIDHKDALSLSPIMDQAEVLELIGLVAQVGVHDDVLEYILALVRATRSHADIELGVSPRGGLALKRSAQAWAFIHGRDFVTPSDVRRVCLPVLSHRIVTRGHSPAGTIEAVLDETPIPV